MNKEPRFEAVKLEGYYHILDTKENCFVGKMVEGKLKHVRFKTVTSTAECIYNLIEQLGVAGG